MISHRVSFVKHFFRAFSNFFSIRFHLFAPLADSLHILSRRCPFVKHYFQIFSIFLFCVQNLGFRVQNEYLRCIFDALVAIRYCRNMRLYSSGRQVTLFGSSPLFSHMGVRYRNTYSNHILICYSQYGNCVDSCMATHFGESEYGMATS